MISIANLVRSSRLPGALALLVAASIAAMPAHADSTKKTVDAIAEMLQAGKFKALNDGATFYMPLERKGGKAAVMMKAVDDQIRITALVAKGTDVAKSPALNTILMDINGKFPVFKLVYDGDGDLVLLYDIFEKMVDAEGFKKLIDSIADDSIEVYKAADFIKKK